MPIRTKRLLLEKCAYELRFPTDMTTSKIAIFAPQFPVTMEISEDYPFHPPVVLYKDVLLNKYFMNLFSQHPLVKRFRLKIPCVCCSSVLNAWSPAHTLQDILAEVEKHAQTETLLNHFPVLFDDLVTSRILAFLL
jgi:hypothetical protein